MGCHAIKKLECANHTCKCYRGALEKLIQDNPSYKGSGGLILKMRKRLVSEAMCAMRMRSRESNTRQALASLKKDLVNGPYHCFGHHTWCSPDFCTTARDKLHVHQASSTGIGDNEDKGEDSTRDDDDDLQGRSLCL